MSVLAGLFDDLNNMGQVRLLLAFTACIAAVCTLGGLLAPRARLLAGLTAAGSTVAFIASSDWWPNAVVLAVMAIAALGLFTAAVWTITRLIGLEPQGRNDAQRLDSALPMDSVPGGTSTAPSRSNRRHIPSI